MKKKYISSFLSLVFGLFYSVDCFAQIVANNDTFSNLDGIGGSGNYYQTNGYRVVNNDLLNGNPISSSQAVLTQISTTNPLVTLVTNFGGYINVAPGTPAGTYYVEYQICSVANPNLCDIGLITVNVCAVPAPVIVTGCDAPIGSVQLQGLPSTGTWSLLRQSSNQSGYYGITTGSGSTFTDTQVTPGNCYRYKVQYDGCSSAATTSICPGYLDNGIEGIMTSNYVDYNNDGIANLGDIVQYNLTVTNTLDCMMETVNYYVSGASYTNATILNLAPGVTETVTINYIITQVDINSGYVNEWIAVAGHSNGNVSYIKVFDNEGIDLNISDGLWLIPFLDANNNGIKDANEQFYTGGCFEYEINNDGQTHHLYTSSNSIYIYESNPANLYNISFTFGSNNCQYSLATPSYSNISVADGSGITSYYFPITTTSCTDLSIGLHPIEWPRPGFTYIQRIFYKNFGNQTVSSPTITFIKDDLLTITNVSASGAVMTPTGFTYALSSLTPNQSGTIDVTMQVPNIPEIELGDTLTNNASITMSVVDTVPANNNDILTQTVVGSYDPNDKQESHGSQILHSTFTANDYLTYTIRFENTGTADAINVKVTDLLDSKLDESSIKMVYSSHSYILERVENNLTWKFSGINLPPSTETVSGRGSIVFQIKPKPGYAVGDIISNTADIYFDFNPAIVTNTFTTEFVVQLGTDDFANDDFIFYPNPVQNNLSLSHTEKIDFVSVYSLLGHKVFEVAPNTLQTELDLSGLSSGTYLLKVKSENKEKTIRFIKQ